MMMPNPFQHSLSVSGKDGIHTAAEFRNEVAHGSGNSFVCLIVVGIFLPQIFLSFP